MRKLAPLLLSACALPHVPPAPRPLPSQLSTVAKIYVQCNGLGMVPDRIATAVIISEKHALTAQHAVWCPDLPRVTLTLPDGRWQMMDVIQESEAEDVAKLEIASADRFGLDVPPPSIRIPGYDDTVCLQPFRRDRACGDIDAMDRFNAPNVPGDSGSPVYDGEDLIGIVQASEGDETVYVPIDASWLKGT